MNKPQNANHPHIHRKKTALSPYVIDLRYPEPHTARSNQLSTVSPSTPNPFVHDLRVTMNDLAGQLREQDGVRMSPAPIWSAVHHEPLFSKSPSDLFAELKQEAITEAFTGMQLPELELQESENAEADVVELFVTDSHVAAITSLPTENHQPSTVDQQRFTWPLGWKKAIAGFVALSFVFVLPIHAMQQIEQAKNDREQIQNSGIQALSRFRHGTSHLSAQDYENAAGDFRSARASFLSAQEKIADLSGIIDTTLRAVPKVGATYTSATALVDAGEDLTDSAALFASALNEIRETTSTSPIVKLDILTAYIERIQPLLEHASQALDHVTVTSLPAAYQSDIETLKQTVPLLAASAKEFLTMNQTLRTILGADGPMRYLVLFQNNSELRPTGGFIGSFAELTIEDGAITKIDIPAGGSYDLQGSLQAFVSAPYALQLLRARWEFQDANWFADFPTSAKKLLWFYDQSGGPTVDGVMAINASFVAAILQLLGPIDMPEYNETINGETFLEVTQHIVENQEQRASGKPKQFIADLAPKILDRVTAIDAMTFLSALQRVGQGLEERDIQFYFKNAHLMHTIDTLGWSGKIIPTEGDSLLVVNSNLGGGKTDLAIDEQVTIDVAVQPNGSIIDTVTITRTHHGISGDPFTGVNNVNYQRIYVPRGSTLLSATGDFAVPAPSLFETSDLPLHVDADLQTIEENASVDRASETIISEESDHTVFANWTQTKPGESSTVVYTYRLPHVLSRPSSGLLEQVKSFIGWSTSAPYTLLIQKQSGVIARSTTVRVHLPSGWQTRWASDEALLSAQGLTLDATQDISTALLFDSASPL